MDNVVIFADHNIGYELVDYLYKNQTSFVIKAIYTNKNENSWWKRLENNPDIVHLLKYYDPNSTPIELLDESIDYLLLLSWKHLLPEPLINHIYNKIVNLHYSLLPIHKGVYPVNWAIQDGDKLTGVTYHIVDKGIDTGAIIAQEELNILWTDDSYTLLNKLDKLAIQLFKNIWEIRTKWDNQIVNQNKGGKYNSRKDFEKSNQINLYKNYIAKDFINILRAKTFNDKSSAYFIDEETGIKYSINIKITKLDE
ncbi:MAG: hypothetical protein KBG11_02160 [Bacteroidia bacterium]|nr:hypothetical protein [Bacteroidia bacterium]